MKTAKQLSKWVVIKSEKVGEGIKTTHQFFYTQKEALAWAKGRGKCNLFSISYKWKREMR